MFESRPRKAGAWCKLDLLQNVTFQDQFSFSCPQIVFATLHIPFLLCIFSFSLEFLEPSHQREVWFSQSQGYPMDRQRIRLY